MRHPHSEIGFGRGIDIPTRLCHMVLFVGGGGAGAHYHVIVYCVFMSPL